jgi:two-component system, OmpR family, sensor histidine kinase CiaH
MTISVLFSSLVYRGVTVEIERGVHLQALRMVPLDDFLPPNFQDQIIDEARSRIIEELFVLNFAILITSGCAGYFLAGKTLKPISEMVEEQKQFIADASHEIRTPLTSIKTEIEVAMRDKKLDLTEAKEILQSNLEEIDKLKMLSDYLLNINKYQNLKDNLNFEVIDLGLEVSNSINSVKSLAKAKKIEIVSDLVEIKIRGNRQSIFELSTILLDNAIKYSSQSEKIQVRVYGDKHHAIFLVEDHGVGIKNSDISHVFDRFFRADSSRTKNQISGFGLGLSIAKSIVDLHRGRITVNSELGKGTKFIVTLPMFA